MERAIEMTRVDRAMMWAAIAAVFCAPLSKPGTNIALGLLALLLPFASNLRERVVRQLKSPVVRAGAAMFAVYLVSALHADSTGAATSVWAYRTLIAVGFIGLALPTNAQRLKAWWAFIFGSAILFLFSIAHGYGMIPRVSVTAVGQFGFSKHYGQQGLVYIVAAAACASFALTHVLPKQRIALLASAALFALSTPLLLEGRMSWIVLGCVVLLLSIYFLGVKRGVLATCLAAVLVAAIAWLSPLNASRWSATKGDVEAAVSGEVRNSWGVRAELLRIAPQVIAQAPLLGHGMGSWNAQMRATAPDRMNPLIEHLVNPHQEILFIAAEQGLLGAAVYLVLAFLLIRSVVRMQGVAKPLYVALVVAYLGYGLFNAVLADFTHRHVFILLLALMPLNLHSYENDKVGTK
jgi:O-antigen ligase